MGAGYTCCQQADLIYPIYTVGKWGQVTRPVYSYGFAVVSTDCPVKIRTTDYRRDFYGNGRSRSRKQKDREFRLLAPIPSLRPNSAQFLRRSWLYAYYSSVYGHMSIPFGKLCFFPQYFKQWWNIVCKSVSGKMFAIQRAESCQLNLDSQQKTWPYLLPSTKVVIFVHCNTCYHSSSCINGGKKIVNNMSALCRFQTARRVC